MSETAKRWGYALWMLFILAFAAAHLVHLRADFPNHSPWISDWAKYTDEGWYANAAVRAHLLGRWYIPGDFNPAVALPVWPFLEWLLFSATGVSIAAARAFSASLFCLDLALGYLLVRTSAPRWAALLAVTLAVTSPFLFAFSRLAILEPALIGFTLMALHIALRLPRMRRPRMGAAGVGVLLLLMVLTKTSAVFLAPAVGFAVLAPLWRDRRLALRCASVALGTATIGLAAWLALIVHAGLLADFRYLFAINAYPKPHEWYWPIASFWWALRGSFWGGTILMAAAVVGTIAPFVLFRSPWSRSLRSNPAFGTCALAALGYLFFMTAQDHPQPRYYTVVALFATLLTGFAAHALVTAAAVKGSTDGLYALHLNDLALSPAGIASIALLLALSAATIRNAMWTFSYVAHPQYTYADAARRLTHYIDSHGGGNRLLLSTSGDEIALMTHLPSLCDEFGTEALPAKIAHYRPGWWATWNDVDAATLAQVHVHDSVEQVAAFRALDHPYRNVLILFKLRPLPQGQVRSAANPLLEGPLPNDRIDVPVD